MRSAGQFQGVTVVGVALRCGCSAVVVVTARFIVAKCERCKGTSRNGYVGGRIIGGRIGIYGSRRSAARAVRTSRAAARTTIDVGNPSIFQLSAVEVADHRIQGNGIASHGFGGHGIVTGTAVCAIRAVYVDGVTVVIFNRHVSVLRVGNVADFTRDVVFVSRGGVVRHRCADFCRVRNRYGGVCRRQIRRRIVGGFISACAVVRVDNGGDDFTAVCNARRGIHTRGDAFAEHQPSKFGIVNEYVSSTRNRLYGVVSTHFPRIYGVFLHPFQKDVQVFDNPARAPHIAGVAPTSIDIKDDTCAVTVQVQLAAAFIVGVIVTAGFAVCGVAAAAVFAGCRRTNHHYVVFIAPTKPLTVGPSVFLVPARGLIVPVRTDGYARIEGRNPLVVTIQNTVGVFQQAVVFLVAVFIRVL